jgi:hypothetical protein
MGLWIRYETLEAAQPSGPRKLSANPFRPNCSIETVAACCQVSAKVAPGSPTHSKRTQRTARQTLRDPHFGPPGSESTRSSSPVHPRLSISRPRHGDTGHAAYNAPQPRLLPAIRPSRPHVLPGSATGATITLEIPTTSVAPGVAALSETNRSHPHGALFAVGRPLSA